MQNCAILIMSCDKYEDCWQPFFYLKNKYWESNYKTYICTEVKDCKYAKTIKAIGSWTNRLKQALQQIETDYVILMLEDYFLHNAVDNNIINNCLKVVKDTNAITFNFELKYRQCAGLNNFYDVQLNKQIYLNSTQPSIWNRKLLIDRLSKDQTAQEWEIEIIDSPYMHLINNTNKNIINIGYNLLHKPWGIVHGKWSREAQELFNKEGIKVDYEKRGFYN